MNSATAEKSRLSKVLQRLMSAEGFRRLLARNHSIIAGLIFFWFLWFLGFPQPMCDDLFYSGAGLNMAHGGDLSNPLLIRQQFPGHLFLIYPPIHSFALAAWLKTFGISAATMTGFQVLMYVIIAAATLLWLRQENAPGWIEWLVPFAVATAFLNFGLRPEPLATALTMSGFLLASRWRRNGLLLFFGFFLMALGAATAPRTTLFSAALIIIAAFGAWNDAETPRYNARKFIAAASGVLTALFVFLLCLDFRLVEFWKAFHHYSQLVGGSKWHLLGLFFTRYVGVTQWPVFPLYLALLAFSFRLAPQPLKWVGAAMAAAFVPAALIGGLGDGTIWFALLGVFALMAGFLRSQITQSAKIVLSGAFIGILLFANLKTFMNIAGIVSGNITMDMGVDREKASALRSTPEHPVLLDESTARYVYDYRIPPGFIYWPFAAPFPAEQAVDAKILPGDVYVLGPLYVDKLVELRLLTMPKRPLWGMGNRRWSFYGNPREFFIISAKNLESQAQIPLTK